MGNRKEKSKTTWKDIKSLLAFVISTICCLILKDSVWLDTLGARLGKSAVTVVFIVVMVLVGAVMCGIFGVIDRIIEKKRHQAKKPSPQGES